MGPMSKNTWQGSTPSGRNAGELDTMDPRVQNALEAGTALPSFPGKAAPSPRRMKPAGDRDLMIRRQIEQEGVVTDTRESHQNAGSRDTTTAEQPGMPQTGSETRSTTRRRQGQWQATREGGNRSQGVDAADREDLREVKRSQCRERGRRAHGAQPQAGG